MTHENETLLASLESFRDLANGNARVKPLIKGWNPWIVVNATDTSLEYSLEVRDMAMHAIVPGKQQGEHVILVQAAEEMLKEIFRGTRNPAEAVLDGDLAVFGTDKDQVKLDAISLILWGL
jgi:hypothetical protein